MANSAAIIGAPTVSDVTEDTNLQTLVAAGLISISDANAGQAAFKTTVISASGNLGTLTIAANGAYSYSVADSSVQYLGAGDTKIDTFTVTSVDGTTKKVSFTIHGVNDAAVIGNPTAHDVTEDATKPKLTATGSISISDVDQGEATFKTSVISSGGNLGTLTLATNGSYSYSVANSAVQYLGAGDTKIDTFTVTSNDGTTKQISFTIHGVNDAAVIGTPTVHDVTEDATNPFLTANGMISITDADQGQAAFKTSVISAAGNLGNLTIAANGSYSYSVADSAVQYLGTGDTKVDTFTVTSLDGTTKQVSFTIHGVNDAAVIGTPTVHDVTEDATQPLLYALGTISISDADQGEAAFQLGIISGAGALGTLILLPNGAYAYFVADSAVQYLGANDVKVDTFTIKSVDGTTKQISFTIHGTNDVAVIGTPNVHDVTEDSNLTTLTATGSISISDADQGQAAFQATVVSAAGNLGTLTLAANGSYSYSVADSATQYLGAGDTKTDTFTIAAVDGTTKQVTFTIHGVNDAAVIGTPTVHDVTADPSLVTLTASGSISISDADQGQASFKTSVTSASGNLGHLTLASNGSYSYTVAESAAAQLGTGGTKVDTFTVTSLDGTTKQVTFTVHGASATNHPAVIGDPTVADVTEDSSPTTLTATGSISITDADAGQASFQTTVGSASGNLGSLVLASNGTYTYSVANNLTQYLGANDIKTDTFTVTSADHTTKQVTFTIHGVNDVAVIDTPSVSSVTEDSNVSNGDLTATGSISITDADQGQASFQTTVTAANGNLGSLVLASNGTYTYTVANSATQYLGVGDTKTDTFTVTSQDGTTQQVSFAIHGAQDAPTLTVGSTASGQDNVNIPLSIAAGLIDTSNTLTITVSNVPTSYTLNHGTPSDDGSTWVLQSADLAGLALVPAGGLAKPGDFNLHIVASSGDGTHLASTSADIALHVTTNPTEISGFGLDGYIAGATVFADANHDGILDLDPNTGKMEVSTTTAADGSFTLSGGTGPIVMFGGTDISTNLSFTGVLSAPAGSTVVTPLTTLIAAIVATGVSAADAASQVATAFGLDTHTDLTTFDPVKAAVSGDAIGSAILSAGIQVQSTVAQVSAAGATADSVFAALATTVSASTASTPIDLSDSQTVSGIVGGLGLSDAAVSAVSSVVAAANQSIQDAGTNLDSIAKAAVVAQGATVAALAAVTDFNDAGQVHDLQTTTIDNLGTQIANAVAGVTGLALLGTLGADVLNGGGGNDAIDGLDGNDIINGGAGNDQLYGGAGNDILTGGAGDDRIDGGAGFDKASYADAAAGVAIDLTAGTVHSIAANDAANVGNDTLISIEGVIGSDFADTFNAAGFTGSTLLPGRPIGFDDFEGKGGDDTIIGTVNASGEILTRASYASAAAAVTVDLAAGTGHGTAAGDAAQVGNDTLINVNSVIGSAYDDTLLGGNNPNGTFEQYDGRAGNDLIDGRGGYDFAVYNNDATTTTGINVQLAAGIVTGDASIGTDTLRSVEAVRGTNFADVYDATGFSGTSTNAGSSGTFNNFDGQGGNDTIIGNGNTRIQYSQSLAAVTVDLALGTAHGTAAGDIANVGTDTFTGVNAVMGSMYDDTLLGSSGNDNFQGLAGNDYIDGRGGFDTAQYNNLTYVTGSVSVDMASGTVVGDSSNGTDTLRSIEGIQGTFFNDTYVATGYGLAGALNVGNNGTFNQFEGMGGNDTITGNGNTRLGYFNATAGVTVNIATGTATGDTSVGTDTFTGVNSVTGSAFADSITGDGNSNTLTGGGGNDAIDGGGGADLALFTGAKGGYTISFNTPTSGQVQVQDNTAGRDGTDTLTNIEVLQFNDQSDLIASGSAGAPIDISDNRLFFGATGNPLNVLTGSNDDFVKIGFSLSGHVINLGAGTGDTVILGQTGFYSLNLVGVENVVGSGGDDTASFTTNLNGLNVDLGAGTNDFVNLANGANTLSVTNVENVNATDFSGAASNDTLTLSNNVSGLNVNLAQGNNTLNLAAGSNNFNNIFNVQHINGTAGDDTLSISNGFFEPGNNPIVDLGGGNNTLNFGSNFASFSLLNVGHLNGDSQDNSISLNNDVSGLVVDLGAGNDNLTLASGTNSVNLTNVENINTADYFGGTAAASDDTLTLLNDVNGITINLQQGNNTLNLAAGSNSLTAYNLQNINGSASDDTLTLLNQTYSATIDLGGGNNTLNLADGGNNVTVANVANVTGGSGNDVIVVAGVAGTTTVTGGAGPDTITAGSAPLNVRFTSAADSAANSERDTVNNFDASNDTFVFDHVGGLASGIHFVGSAGFDGTGAEARLSGNLLQIDINGDGLITAGDMEIYVNGLNGTLSDANFVTTGVDHAPTDILLSAAAVAENSANGTVVGALSAIDPDAGDTATFSLVNDAGGLFAISNGNLVVNGPLNYEAASSQQVTVRVTDGGGLIHDKNFTIAVTDVNEAPTAVVLSNQVVSTVENGGDVKVADIAITDDALGTNTLSLSGADAAFFSIVSGANGPELHFSGGANFEAKAFYDVTVNANDAAASNHAAPDASQSFHLTIADVNEAPTDITLAGNSVAENSAVGTFVGHLSPVDPDIGDIVQTLTLTDSAGGRFAISGNNLVVNGPLDYETASSYQVTVRTTDGGGLSFDKTFTINVTDVNEAPTAVALNNQVTSTAENGGDVKVADIAITDDALGTNTLSLSGADAASFAILNGNELHFVGGADFEAKTGYDVTVNVNDATASNHVTPDASQNFHLAITNVNEAPTDISLSNSTIGQSSTNGTVVGALSAIDPDAGDNATFSIVDGAGGQFAVSGNNLVVVGPLTAGPQQVIVRDTDSGGLTVDKTLTINVSTGATIVGDANNNTLVGTAGVDNIFGLDGNDRLQGLAGNDMLDGGNGFDRAVYTDATGPVTVNLAAGTASGAGVGTDTLVSIEGAVGSAFNDTFDATGFTGSSTQPGVALGQSSFEGAGGDDVITGRINSLGQSVTRVEYLSASAAVTVDLAAGTGQGTAAGDVANVGHDTFTNALQGVFGSAYNDTIYGSNNANFTYEVFEGRGGDDYIDGRGGYDIVTYNNDTTTTTGITVHLAAGTVTGDATVGTDTLRDIEAVRGTNFDDVFDTTGYGLAGALNVSSTNGNFNDIAGAGGNDTIIGNGNTRLNYSIAAAAVTVDLETSVPGTTNAITVAGSATGATEGTDTFTGVNAVQASMFNDTLLGSSFSNTFTPLGGDDYIDGRGGFDTASYNNLNTVTGGITVNMAAGTVTGDASIGNDTLRNIEGIQGTGYADSYDATGYGLAGALNVSTSNGNFNQFEGLGGNDTITGNGNTRVLYSNATGAVTVDLSLGIAHGTAGGDVANVGTDTITGGVNSVQGSNFNDTLIGGAGNELFFGGGGNDSISTGGGNDQITGQAGNDTIDGGTGTDMAIYTGPMSAYTITTPGAGQTQVADSVSTRDGTDVLTNVEVLQFSDAAMLLSSGSSGSPIDISAFNLNFNTPLTGTGNDDFLLVGGNIFGHQIDLGAGNDTVMLASGGFFSLNLLHVENVVGSNGDDTVTLVNDASGLSVDLGSGNDNLNLANGSNTLTVAHVENINATDFSGTASDDTLTLSNDVSGLSVNLAQGNNTLNLAAGSNSFVNIFNVQHINGTASDDTLTVTNGVFEPGNNPTIDLGAGDNTLHLGGGGTFTLLNVEHLIADGPNSFVTLNNDVTGLSVDLGTGNDNLTLANGTNSLSIVHVQSIGGSDFSGTASDDTLNLLNDIGGGVTVNLGLGSNTLNLAAGSNTFDNLFNFAQINGTSSDDTLTIQGNTANTTIDLGSGNDTLNLNGGSFNLTVANAETINGSSNFDTITISNAVTGSTTITAGAGADNITASAGADNFRFTSVADSTINGQADTITNFDASHDTFTFAGITVAGGQIDYVGAGTFEGSGHASAVLQNFGLGNDVLNIDINGDGVMDSADMVVNLTNLQGTLQNSNFLLA